MLYHLLYPLSDTIGAFNVFRYPSFRIVGATLCALAIALIFFPRFIDYPRRVQRGSSNIRSLRSMST